METVGIVLLLAFSALLVFSVPPAAHADGIILQSANGGCADTASTGCPSSITVALSNPVAAGHIIVVTVTVLTTRREGAFFSSVGDSIGTPISGGTSTCNGSYICAYIFYGTAHSSGADTVTVDLAAPGFTFSAGGGTAVNVNVFELTEVTAVPFPTTATGASSGDTMFTSSWLAFQTASFILGVGTMGVAQTLTPRTGFSAAPVYNDTGFVEDSISGTSPTNFAVSLSKIAAFAMAGIVFEPSAPVGASLLQEAAGVGSGSTSATATLPAAVTKGDLIAVVVDASSDVSVTASDTLSTSFSSVVATDGNLAGIYYGQLASSGSDTVTVTLGSAANLQVYVYEVANVQLSSISYAAGTGTGCSDACIDDVVTTGSIIFGLGSFVVGAFQDNNAGGSPSTPTASFPSVLSAAAQASPAFYTMGFAAYEVSNAVGNLPANMQVTVDLGTGGPWAAVGASFAPKAASTTTVSCSPSTFTAGASTACTATVPASSSGDTVSFSSDSFTGSFSSSTCTIGVGADSCSVSYTDSAKGTYSVTAAYAGSSTTVASSGTTTVLVTAQAPKPPVSCADPGSAYYGKVPVCIGSIVLSPTGMSAAAGTTEGAANGHIEGSGYPGCGDSCSYTLFTFAVSLYDKAGNPIAGPELGGAWVTLPSFTFVSTPTNVVFGDCYFVSGHSGPVCTVAVEYPFTGTATFQLSVSGVTSNTVTVTVTGTWPACASAGTCAG